MLLSSSAPCIVTLENCSECLCVGENEPLCETGEPLWRSWSSAAEEERQVNRYFRPHIPVGTLNARPRKMLPTSVADLVHTESFAPLTAQHGTLSPL